MSLSGQGFMILGAFRSGTSSLAAVLVRLGVYFGEASELYGANEHNPGGHFELMDIQRLDNSVFDAFAMKYYTGGALPENWMEHPVSGMIVQALNGILTKHFAGRKLYGWKNPSSSGLVPIYKAALRDERVRMKYPICFRHPLSVVSSMRKRAGTAAKLTSGNRPEDHSSIDHRMMGVWLSYTLSSLKDTNGCDRQIFSYENFLADPETYVKRIAGMLEAPASEERVSAAIASIRPEWSHTRFSVEDLDGWPELVGRTYQLCLRADQDPEGFSAGHFDDEIDVLWDEWELERKAFRNDWDPEATALLSWRSEGGQKRFEQALGQNWGWTTIQAPIDARNGELVAFTPYSAPCQAWIRRAHWRQNGRTERAVLKPTANGKLQSVYGLPLLDAFGPEPLLLRAPGGDAILEMEFLVEANRDVLMHLLRETSGRTT